MPPTRDIIKAGLAGFGIALLGTFLGAPFWLVLLACAAVGFLIGVGIL